MDNIYVFGRGELFKRKYFHISQKYNIIGILDNAVEKETVDNWSGIIVYNPNCVSLLHQYPIMIVSIHFIDMWKQLKKLGIKDEFIMFGNFIPPLINQVESIMYEQGAVLFSREKKIVYKTPDQENVFSSEDEFHILLRKIYRKKCCMISSICNMECFPVSNIFGLERGTAIDRYYINKFIQNHQNDLYGTVMEVAEPRYIRLFDNGKIEHELIIHVEGWDGAIKANLESGDGLSIESVDCFICTQTLQYVYDLRAAMKTIYALLKPNGVALITVPGIKPISLYDDAHWDDYWSFTKKAVIRLFHDICPSGGYEVETYGNVKTAMGYLYGLCAEDLEEEDFKYCDGQYPLVVCARFQKI